MVFFIVFVFLIKSILFIIVSQGDSGGPLYMRYIIDGQKKSAYFDNSKPWYLLGIVSFGTKKCGSGNPAIYTRQVMLINFSFFVVKGDFGCEPQQAENDV